MADETIVTSVPQIRLDSDRPWSPSSGDRTPDDPHYRVVAFQGQKIRLKDKRTGRMAEKMVMLPFDAQGDLVPDDGKKEPWNGLNAEQKPCVYHPLWNDEMRELHRLLVKKAQERGEEEQQEPELVEAERAAAPQIDFKSWLTGKAHPTWPALQKAAKAQLHRVYSTKDSMVIELVIEDQLVPRDAVCPELAVYLKKADAA